jgi:iron uptake system component EfeO
MVPRSVAALLTAGLAVVLAGCTGAAPEDSGPPVAGTSAPIDVDAALAAATGDYRRHLDAQAATVVTRTREFADAVKAGDVERAKALFPVAHASYEGLEPATVGARDLDRTIDGLEDEHGPDVAWTGYHRLEKDLWSDGLQPDSGQIADRLVTDVEELRTQTETLRLAPEDLGGTAIGLLDEAITETIPGREDRWSGTDLWDLRANIDGAAAAVAPLRPVLDVKDPTLGPLLDQRFAAVDRLLEEYRVGDGFRSYAELTANDLKRMTDTVDALSEPVSQVSGIVTS